MNLRVLDGRKEKKTKQKPPTGYKNKTYKYKIFTVAFPNG